MWNVSSSNSKVGGLPCTVSTCPSLQATQTLITFVSNFLSCLCLCFLPFTLSTVPPFAASHSVCISLFHHMPNLSLSLFLLYFLIHLTHHGSFLISGKNYVQLINPGNGWQARMKLQVGTGNILYHLQTTGIRPPWNCYGWESLVENVCLPTKLPHTDTGVLGIQSN